MWMWAREYSWHLSWLQIFSCTLGFKDLYCNILLEGDNDTCSIISISKPGGLVDQSGENWFLEKLLKKESNYGNCRSYVFEEERDIMCKIIVNVNNYIALDCHQLRNIGDWISLVEEILNSIYWSYYSVTSLSWIWNQCECDQEKTLDIFLWLRMMCTSSFNICIALNCLRMILCYVGENKHTSILHVQKLGGVSWSVWRELAVGKTKQEWLIM